MGQTIAFDSCATSSLDRTVEVMTLPSSQSQDMAPTGVIVRPQPLLRRTPLPTSEQSDPASTVASWNGVPFADLDVPHWAEPLGVALHRDAEPGDC